MKKSSSLPKLIIAVLIFTSCATMADYNFSSIDAAVFRGDYDSVYSELESPNGILYTSTDKVLENLDKGIISHYAGEAERSNKELSEAETLIRRYYSKSISQAAASAFINDTVIDYSGDPYEDIYTNIFKALNYIELGEIDSAFVEIRRFDIKLREITSHYQVEIENQKMQIEGSTQSVPSGEIKFHNSALARYISMLLYRTEGDIDSAEIDYRKIKEAFALQPSLYPFAVPASIKDELSVPKGSARLNVLAFSGLSPIKHEETLPLFALDGYYRIALPAMTLRQSHIVKAEITAVDTTTGDVYRGTAEKLESIENIAVDTYSQKYAIIVARTIGRMVAKLTTTAALDAAADNTDDAVSGVFQILGLMSRATAFLSERADVRTSRYFPASALVCGITVPDGVYDITVSYESNSGKTIESYMYQDREVTAGSLNLVESVCLK